MKLAPTNAHVIVSIRDATAQAKKSGIVIPNQTDTRPTRDGTVVAAGPGTEDMRQPYKVGDRVVFNKNAGIDVDHDAGEGTKTHRLLHANEIIAVVTAE